VFDAPREQVFRSWVRAEDVAAWFAPAGFTVTRCQVDARIGGQWIVEFEAEGGETYREYGEFRELTAPERLTFTLTQQDPHGLSGPETLVSVVFVDRGARTLILFEQAGFPSKAMRNAIALGWQTCFRKLDSHLLEPGPEPDFTIA
jgi:uncharacterized protein YndB with AHSA1/START domain